MIVKKRGTLPTFPHASVQSLPSMYIQLGIHGYLLSYYTLISVYLGAVLYAAGFLFASYLLDLIALFRQAIKVLIVYVLLH